MKIQFTKRNTIATCLASTLAEQPGTQEYYLKAIKSGGKTVQHVGKATVYPEGMKPWKLLKSPGVPKYTADDLRMFIIVETCNGKRLGRVKTRKEAAAMIHNYHKTNPLYIGHNQNLCNGAKS